MKRLVFSLLSVFSLCGCANNENVSVVGLGQSASYPNAVVVNISGTDKSVDTEWYQDGVSMGALQKVGEDCYIAVPSQYAQRANLIVRGGSGREFTFDVDLTDYVDVQAHRGGAGLMPENTLEAMIAAVDLGVNTLELDLVLMIHISTRGTRFVQTVLLSCGANPRIGYIR